MTMYETAVKQLQEIFRKNPPHSSWRQKWHFFSDPQSVPDELTAEIQRQVTLLEKTFKDHPTGLSNLLNFIQMSTDKKNLAHPSYMFSVTEMPVHATAVKVLFSHRLADQLGGILIDASFIPLDQFTLSSRDFMQVLVDCCGKKTGSIESRMLFNSFTESSNMITPSASHVPWPSRALFLNNILTELAENGLSDQLIDRMDNSVNRETTEKILGLRYGLERNVYTHDFVVDVTASQTLLTARLIRLMSQVKITQSEDESSLKVALPNEMQADDQLLLECRLNSILEILTAHRDTAVTIQIVGASISPLRNECLKLTPSGK